MMVSQKEVVLCRACFFFDQKGTTAAVYYLESVTSIKNDKNAVSQSPHHHPTAHEMEALADKDPDDGITKQEKGKW